MTKTFTLDSELILKNLPSYPELERQVSLASIYDDNTVTVTYYLWVSGMRSGLAGNISTRYVVGKIEFTFKDLIEDPDRLQKMAHDIVGPLVNNVRKIVHDVT